MTIVGTADERAQYAARMLASRMKSVAGHEDAKGERDVHGVGGVAAGGLRGGD
jgi:hypothetical protein